MLLNHQMEKLLLHDPMTKSKSKSKCILSK